MSAVERLRLLQTGDHLTVAEFERRYEAMSGLKKAELIEGVVFMPSPVTNDDHGVPHFRFITRLGIYEANKVQAPPNASAAPDSNPNEQVQKEKSLTRRPPALQDTRSKSSP
jgi:hypothetical protein